MDLMNIASILSLALMFATPAFAQDAGDGRRVGHGPGGHHGPPAEVVAAMEACASENGIVFERGRRPNLTTEQRALLDTCLSAKGIQRPSGPRPGGPPPADDGAADAASASR